MTSKTGSIQENQVIITGSKGFLGRHLTQFLLKNDMRVMALGSREELKSLLENNSKPFLANGSQVTVIHFAGKSHAGDCQKDPRSAFESNVSLTFQILEFCRRHHIKKFIFPSTGIVYGNTKEHPAKEDSPIQPCNIYSATKLAAENLIRGYAENYHLDATIIRLSNVYGPEGNPDTVAQVILQQVKKGPDSIILRSGLPTRDFIFIDDVIEAFYKLLLSDLGDGCRIFNVSTGIGTSVFSFAKTACKIAGVSPDRIQTLHEIAEDDSVLILDNVLLKQHTGWKPKFSLSAGLMRILKESL